jgi:membrane protease YdiL (CAAX protease family)
VRWAQWKEISMINKNESYKSESFELRNLVFFFILAFGLTWISVILLGLFDLKMPAAIPILLLVGLPGAFGPTVAAFIMTGITYGKSGINDLWNHFWNRNLNIIWLLVILLSYDLLRLVANIIARIIYGQNYQIIDLASPIWIIIPLFFQAFILSGMGEEFGWRGYALPRFQAKWNALTSSIVLGLIWASWHIPFFFIHNQPLYQRNFWEWVPLILLSSVIYTWIFNNTKGSVLAAALIHASLNTSVVVLPTYSSLWYYYGIMLLAVILIVIIFGPKNFVRQRPEEAT